MAQRRRTEEEEEPPLSAAALVLLPDIVHARITDFCSRLDHARLISTNSRIRSACTACLEEVQLRSTHPTGDRPEEESVKEGAHMVSLLRRMPKVKGLTLLHPRPGHLTPLWSAVREGNFCGQLVLLTLDGRAELSGGDVEALAGALRAGALPGLFCLGLFARAPHTGLSALVGALEAGVSPCLAALGCAADRRVMGSLARALEARKRLGCEPLRILRLDQWLCEGMYDPTDPEVPFAA